MNDINDQPISFTDKSSGDDALLGIRVVGDSVGLTLSLRASGDVEVFMGADEIGRVIERLQAARAAIHPTT
ncbi:hypothetical protein [Bradyrhizobium sp. SRS-191]|uniref:hypothetical protein n=1 Tax=Bradyrhizobium sp. SRS-191 TaxID=2962606 RepID=UPI00211F1C84|nr:hypothetical protein [Bradyrhizobium sp. SRS-191]